LVGFCFYSGFTVENYCSAIHFRNNNQPIIVRIIRIEINRCGLKLRGVAVVGGVVAGVMVMGKITLPYVPAVSSKIMVSGSISL
jgi:hypothetical protein